MAQYKVPQDVEADDKLIGPFTFRQFIYLLIMSGAIAIAWALFQIFPLLAIAPLPVVFFFGILALPIKKDQPMETYLVALINFYLKPRKRLWIPGQKESSILITAPKKAESLRVRNITEQEAGNRLSFLANLVDSEGQSIHNNTKSIRQEYIAEANAITDIMDTNSSFNINQIITKEQTDRHNELINQMREAIRRHESLNSEPPTISKNFTSTITPLSLSTSHPSIPSQSKSIISPTPTSTPTPTSQSSSTPQSIASISKQSRLQQLAKNSDYSVETIQKEAARISQNSNEIYISLH